MAFWDFWKGSPEKHKRVSTLLRQQKPVFNQLTSAAQDQGAGGAFGDAADYYRNLMSDNPEDLAAFAAPAERQFREQILPGISEQFAGMGAGGLSSSGFRNAAVGAGTDLAERLGALRANLRMQGAQGLQNIGQSALGNYSQDVMTQPGSEGMLSTFAPAIGTAIGGAVGGPIGAGIGGGIGSMYGSSSQKGKSNPYGGMGTNAAFGGMAGLGR